MITTTLNNTCLMVIYRDRGPAWPGQTLIAKDWKIFLSGGQEGSKLLQISNGNFSASVQPDFETGKMSEGVAATLCDFNGDGFTDLYVGSGSNELNRDDALLQDLLYLNNGKGQFTNAAALPPCITVLQLLPLPCLQTAAGFGNHCWQMTSITMVT